MLTRLILQSLVMENNETIVELLHKNLDLLVLKFKNDKDDFL